MGANASHRLSEQLSLVALGGFGRGEMSPHSDVDLMFLYRGETVERTQGFSAALLRHLWDIGFQVGHSVRTIEDCIALAKNDLSAKTALMESRFLIGSASLFRSFHEQFWRRVGDCRVDEFLVNKVKERDQEYDRYGTSVYMLEPDIKRSKGGLRDIHLVKWAALARYRIATLEDLYHKAFLSSKDFHALSQAREFLWRVRAELHFHSGSAQDILTFDEQIRLAELFGFGNQPHLLGVERFMQQYYRHTTAVADISARFVKRCRLRSIWDRLNNLLPSRRPERGFLVVNRCLTIDPAFRGEVMGDGTMLLRLFYLSARESILIDDDLLEELHIQIDGMTQDQFVNSAVSEMFLYILSGPHKIAPVLDLMHRVHLLEKIIPAFGWARGLMQFNQYHKYTVDAHTLQAVACAESFTTGVQDPKESLDLSRVYRDIRRKDVLHLALLLHDLGKSQKGDHSLIGGTLAREASQRLGLDDHETALLVFLVEHHLLMSHVSQRRDVSDPKVIQKFAKQVGTPEVLKMLYVLTAADIAAVGPGTLTTWKRDLLTELFVRTLDAVAGVVTVSYDRNADPVRRVVAKLRASVPGWWVETGTMAGHKGWGQWVDAQTSVIPVAYLLSTPHQTILSHLSQIVRLQPGDVAANAAFDSDRGYIDITVYAFDHKTTKIFSKIAGVMAVNGLQVLGARITTRVDHLAIDEFHVVDSHFAGVPPEYRLAELESSIRGVLTGQVSLEALIQSGNRPRFGSRELPAKGEEPKVEIDNESSDHFTIVDVFADDRQGLLYVIANAIAEMGLSVHSAKISTRLDQVVDVFYISDAMGKKVFDTDVLRDMRMRLLADIRRPMEYHIAEPAA